MPTVATNRSAVVVGARAAWCPGLPLSLLHRAEDEHDLEGLKENTSHWTSVLLSPRTAAASPVNGSTGVSYGEPGMSVLPAFISTHRATSSMTKVLYYQPRDRAGFHSTEVPSLRSTLPVVDRHATGVAVKEGSVAPD